MWMTVRLLASERVRTLANSRVRISDVDASDNGVYSCSARNEAGTVTSQHNFVLNVHRASLHTSITPFSYKHNFRGSSFFVNSSQKMLRGSRQHVNRMSCMYVWPITRMLRGSYEETAHAECSLCAVVVTVCLSVRPSVTLINTEFYQNAPFMIAFSSSLSANVFTNTIKNRNSFCTILQQKPRNFISVCLKFKPAIIAKKIAARCMQ